MDFSNANLANTNLRGGSQMKELYFYCIRETKLSQFMDTYQQYTDGVIESHVVCEKTYEHTKKEIYKKHGIVTRMAEIVSFSKL